MPTYTKSDYFNLSFLKIYIIYILVVSGWVRRKVADVLKKISERSLTGCVWSISNLDYGSVRIDLYVSWVVLDWSTFPEQILKNSDKFGVYFRGICRHTNMWMWINYLQSKLYIGRSFVLILYLLMMFISFRSHSIILYMLYDSVDYIKIVLFIYYLIFIFYVSFVQLLRSRIT